MVENWLSSKCCKYVKNICECYTPSCTSNTCQVLNRYTERSRSTPPPLRFHSRLSKCEDLSLSPENKPFYSDRITFDINVMEDYRLPASLVGMLKATRLTGIPRIQTDLQTATLAVTITWELASSTTKKKMTKPPASKKTAPTTKKKKSPSPSTESSEPPKKSSTPPPPPKPAPPPSPKPTPVPSPPKPKPSPKPTPPSPRKASRLQENVQRFQGSYSTTCSTGWAHSRA